MFTLFTQDCDTIKKNEIPYSMEGSINKKMHFFHNGPFPEAFNLQTLRNVALHVSPKDTYFGGAKREGEK